MFRLIGLFAIIPTTLLLSVSFFILFAVRKIEGLSLKSFGYCIAALLWASALLIFSTGIYTLSTGRHPAMCMMQEMMKDKMHCMTMGDKGPDMMRDQRHLMMKDKMPAAMGDYKGEVKK